MRRHNSQNARWFLILIVFCYIPWGASCRKARNARIYSSAVQKDTTPLRTPPKDGGLQLYSAYFGLDNKLPGRIRQVCLKGKGADGMPVIFSMELDHKTIQAGDFRVVTRSGKIGKVFCATLVPAVDPGELRTVLLIGEFGDAKKDPPEQVEIIGNLYAKTSDDNFKGQKVKVTPLKDGPFLVKAEVVPKEQWKVGATGSVMIGSGCPKETKLAVRAVWAGGITKPGGEPADQKEGKLYQVTLKTKDGKTKEVTPFALADLKDGDNNHLLCLNQTGTPLKVSFPPGFLTDPNEDTKNPFTSVLITP